MVGGDLIADRYELEELVGTGGMSSVYKARDRLLDRNVALKILHEHHLEDADYVERFRREARAVAQLSHPNIVTVIDRGDHEGRQFIVFEYVEGENLKRLIERRGAAPVATALELAMQIARGLLLLKAGTYSNCIRVLCPLTIDNAELDEALAVWEDALETVLGA